MKRTAALVPAVLLLALTGCSAAPSREEVAERYLIEYTSDEGLRDALRESALTFADDALAGKCGDPAYEDAITEGGGENVFYAWRVTCSMYFEDDLSPRQLEETKQMVFERAADSSD